MIIILVIKILSIIVYTNSTVSNTTIITLSYSSNTTNMNCIILIQNIDVYHVAVRADLALLHHGSVI